MKKRRCYFFVSAVFGVFILSAGVCRVGIARYDDVEGGSMSAEILAKRIDALGHKIEHRQKVMGYLKDSCEADWKSWIWMIIPLPFSPILSFVFMCEALKNKFLFVRNF